MQARTWCASCRQGYRWDGNDGSKRCDDGRGDARPKVVRAQFVWCAATQGPLPHPLKTRSPSRLRSFSSLLNLIAISNPISRSDRLPVVSVARDATTSAPTYALQARPSLIYAPDTLPACCGTMTDSLRLRAGRGDRTIRARLQWLSGDLFITCLYLSRMLFGT
ncbi:hypothetical protein L1887_58166 [Cichorium endivia]|nr:hypothetical protein L1887_58166 [Cichorium endivia]